MSQQLLAGAVSIAVFIPTLLGAPQGTTGGEWPVHGGDTAYTRYAPLDQINADNVNDLRVAWRRPGVDASLHARFPDLQYSNNLRSTPLMVGGMLYASNGIGLVEAFDPATGETQWVQELPESGSETPRGAASRGIAYWPGDDEADERILSVRGPYLLATDLGTGRLVPSFGDRGKVDLRYFEDSTEPRGFSFSSAPLVVRDVVVVGAAMADHPPVKEADPGYVRAYDVRTGTLRWTFNPIPQAGQLGVDTWLDDSWQYSGMANVWTMASADAELGLVYLPTGAPTNDMYGGHRPGANLFVNSLVCVRAETGERVWHFQMVHHDLWDYDNNVAPILIDITVDGRPVQAVVQLTKQAIAYVFDRVTGEPVWPIEERAVPGSNTPGEWISPTQPIPTKPAPFDRQGFSIDDLIDFTPELRAEAIKIVEPYILGPLFTPPSIRGDDPTDTKGTLQLPGSVGGAEWGGAGFDPETGMLYVPSVTAAFAADLTPGNPDRMNVRYTRGDRAFPAGPDKATLRSDHGHRHEHGRARLDSAERRRSPESSRAPRPRPAAARATGPRHATGHQVASVRERGGSDHGADATRRGTRGGERIPRLRQDVRRGAVGDGVGGRHHGVADDLPARWQAVHRATDRLARPPGRVGRAGPALT